MGISAPSHVRTKQTAALRQNTPRARADPPESLGNIAFIWLIRPWLFAASHSCAQARRLYQFSD
jgi:hypothetical protein